MLDLYIYHPKQAGHLFNVQTSVGRYGNLMFNVTQLEWQEAIQENKETKLPSMTAQAFGVWFGAMHEVGWNCQKAGE